VALIVVMLVVARSRSGKRGKPRPAQPAEA